MMSCVMLSCQPTLSSSKFENGKLNSQRSKGTPTPFPNGMSLLSFTVTTWHPFKERLGKEQTKTTFWKIKCFYAIFKNSLFRLWENKTKSKLCC